MPTATEPAVGRWRRREVLTAGVALAFSGAAAAAPRRAAVLAAAWDDARGRHHVGLVRVGDDAAQVVDAIEVPTRAHGLACLGDGSVLAVARRPGDWLLRWRPGALAPADWVWAEPERRFNGHVIVVPQGDAIYTTEIDLDRGDGRLVRRDVATLAQTAVWPTGGLDPHDLEWLPGNRLLVANGGIRTLAETGRSKLALDRMDASLVRIDAASGAIDGHWRLADPRLSIRHLAQRAGGVVGVALQAEHDDPADRAAAPVFALFDPAAGVLRPIAPVRSASGYAGDVVAVPGGWLLSCPREHRVQPLSTQGGTAAPLALESACALVADAGAAAAWMLGGGALRRDDAGAAVTALPGGSRFDNHAVLWPGPAGR